MLIADGLIAVHDEVLFAAVVGGNENFTPFDDELVQQVVERGDVPVIGFFTGYLEVFDEDNFVVRNFIGKPGVKHFVGLLEVPVIGDEFGEFAAVEPFGCIAVVAEAIAERDGEHGFAGSGRSPDHRAVVGFGFGAVALEDFVNGLALADDGFRSPP